MIFNQIKWPSSKLSAWRQMLQSSHSNNKSIHSTFSTSHRGHSPFHSCYTYFASINYKSQAILLISIPKNLYYSIVYHFLVSPKALKQVDSSEIQFLSSSSQLSMRQTLKSYLVMPATKFKHTIKDKIHNTFIKFYNDYILMPKFIINKIHYVTSIN